jgi:hypothetical protein
VSLREGKGKARRELLLSFGVGGSLIEGRVTSRFFSFLAFVREVKTSEDGRHLPGQDWAFVHTHSFFESLNDEFTVMSFCAQV